MATQEEKRAKFEELAEKRAAKIMDAVRVLGNLSDKGNYDYTPEHVEAVFGAIDKAVTAAKDEFLGKSQKAFSFKDASIPPLSEVPDAPAPVEEVTGQEATAPAPAPSAEDEIPPPA